MVPAEDEVKGFGFAERNSWVGLRIQGTVLAAYERLGESDARVQQNCKCATAGRGAGGRVDFSISERSSDIPACASAGGNCETEPCAIVAL